MGLNLSCSIPRYPKSFSRVENNPGTKDKVTAAHYSFALVSALLIKLSEEHLNENKITGVLFVARNGEN